MEKRKKIIILIAIAVVVLALLLLWIFWPEQEVVNQNVNQPDGSAPQSLDQLPPASAERQAQEKSYPLGLKELAFSFAERYGSYSSDEPFKNLEDLKLVMTDKMITFVNNVKQDSSFGKNGYEGYDSWALASNLKAYSDDRATVVVSIQRVHYLGGSEDVFNQDLLLEFVKIENEWRVDEAVWQ